MISLPHSNAVHSSFCAMNKRTYISIKIIQFKLLVCKSLICLNSKIKSSSFVDLWFVLSDKDLDSPCYGSQSVAAIIAVLDSSVRCQMSILPWTYRYLWHGLSQPRLANNSQPNVLWRHLVWLQIMFLQHSFISFTNKTRLRSCAWSLDTKNVSIWRVS